MAQHRTPHSMMHKIGYPSPVPHSPSTHNGCDPPWRNQMHRATRLVQLVPRLCVNLTRNAIDLTGAGVREVCRDPLREEGGAWQRCSR
eukprot:3506770-Rhodomonas_salina.3